MVPSQGVARAEFVDGEKGDANQICAPIDTHVCDVTLQAPKFNFRRSGEDRHPKVLVGVEEI